MKYEVTDIEFVDDDIIIATLKFDGPFEITKSFATMLEAAPKMLEALEKLAKLGSGDRYGNSDGNIIAQQAIAAAKGA